LRTLTRKRVDVKRVDGVQPDKIKRLFETMNKPFVKEIRTQNRWNFDETSLQEGTGTNSKVLGLALKKNGKRNRNAIVKGGNKRTWISVIEAINAEGNCIAPAVIFKGADVQAQWFPAELDEYKRWKFAASPKCWTSNDLGYEWLTSHFIPLTATHGKDWRLLTLDGHDSHLTDKFLAACSIHRIYIALIPAHSSHVTQPLDVSVFSVLKAFYRKYLEDFGYQEFGSALSKQNFLACYLQAHEEAFTRRNILSGWRATGLWPVNIQQVWDNPFVISNEPTTPPPVPKEPLKTTLSFRTPQGGQELRNQIARKRSSDSILTRDQREVVAKTAKALDAKNVEIAFLQKEKRALLQQIEDLKPKKKVKVVPDIGKRFVQIAQVQAVKQL